MQSIIKETGAGLFYSSFTRDRNFFNVFISGSINSGYFTSNVNITGLPAYRHVTIKGNHFQYSGYNVTFNGIRLHGQWTYIDGAISMSYDYEKIFIPIENIQFINCYHYSFSITGYI